MSRLITVVFFVDVCLFWHTGVNYIIFFVFVADAVVVVSEVATFDTGSPRCVIEVVQHSEPIWGEIMELTQ